MNKSTAKKFLKGLKEQSPDLSLDQIEKIIEFRVNKRLMTIKAWGKLKKAREICNQ